MHGSALRGRVEGGWGLTLSQTAPLPSPQDTRVRTRGVAQCLVDSASSSSSSPFPLTSEPDLAMLQGLSQSDKDKRLFEAAQYGTVHGETLEVRLLLNARARPEGYKDKVRPVGARLLLWLC